MAQIASEGRVITVDIQPQMLDIVEARRDDHSAAALGFNASHQTGRLRVVGVPWMTDT